MHLKEMGWLVETNESGQISGVIDNKGEAWRPNDAVTWVDFQEELERTRIKTIWEKASSHRDGENLKEGADISVAQRHYKKLVHAGRHAEAGALMNTYAGACWSPARLLEEGIITAKEAVCPRCGHQQADEGYLYWECPKVQENKLPAIQKSNKFCAEYSRCKGDVKNRTLYWRGLVSEQETIPSGPILETVEI